MINSNTAQHKSTNILLLTQAKLPGPIKQVIPVISSNSTQRKSTSDLRLIQAMLTGHITWGILVTYQ